jgi:hypothetical protein
LTCTHNAGKPAGLIEEDSAMRPGNQFMGDAVLGVSMLAGAVAASIANIAQARAEENEVRHEEWTWRDAAEFWRARALRAERALAAAEARLDELD